jgi:hypothetical protein
VKLYLPVIRVEADMSFHAETPRYKVTISNGLETFVYTTATQPKIDQMMEVLIRPVRHDPT